MSDPNSDSRTYAELCDKAQFLMDVNRPAEAIPILMDAVRSAPDRAPAYIHLAWCHRNLKNPADSLKFINRAVEAEPENIWAHCCQSHIFRWLNKPHPAYQAALEAMRLDPEDPLANNVWGFASLDAERDEEAKQAIAVLLRIAPNWFHTYQLQGWANYRWKQFREAEEALRKALVLNPESAEVQNMLGEVCTFLGRIEEGRKLVENAIRMDPGNSAFHWSLEHIKQAGRPDGAEWNKFTGNPHAYLDQDPDIELHPVFIAVVGAGIGVALISKDLRIILGVAFVAIISFILYAGIQIHGVESVLPYWWKKKSSSDESSGKFLNLK